MNDARNQIDQVEQKLRKYLKPEHANRALKTIQTPASEWTDDDHVFMDEVLAYIKQKELMAVNCGCWVIIGVVILCIVLAIVLQ